MNIDHARHLLPRDQSGAPKLQAQTLEEYVADGGYEVYKSILQQQTPREDIIKIVKDSGLRGRGGAGFLTGLKWSFMADNAPHPRYLVCNSDEGEPGTCKDTLMLRFSPHQLLEGMLIACYAMNLDVAYNYMRGEFYDHYQACEKALQEAKDAGLVGDAILGTSFSCQVFHLLGAGSYIVGEETAMIESLEGKAAKPRFKPPFPAVSGLWGQPTIVNNTETLVAVPKILRFGASWYKGLGSENSAGTKFFCVSGHVNEPKTLELPLGIPFSQLIQMCGGIREGRTCKAVIPGGSSMKIIPGEVMMTLNMDYDSIQKAGSSLGTGGVIVMDSQTCMVQAMYDVLKFYKHESCGQCTPCREGTSWSYKILSNILNNKGAISDLNKLYQVAKNIEGRTICAFGEAVAWPVTSFLEHYYHEFAYYIRYGHSLVHDEDAVVHQRLAELASNNIVLER